MNISLPSPGQAAVYIVNPATISAESAAATLTPAEQEQARSFHFDKDAANWRACRAALRQILGAALGAEPAVLPLQFGTYGKPYLPAPFDHLHFNLSHSEGLALVALCSEGSVGIDLEPTGRAASLLGTEDSFCHPDEIASLPEAPTERAAMLLEIWTAKEALLKALGTGMSLAPQSISLAPGKEDLSADLRLDHFRCHRLAHSSFARHIASLAAVVAVKRIEICSFSA